MPSSSLSIRPTRDSIGSSLMRERGDAYGAGLLALWRSDLRDRWRGEQARANARWGFLSPPSGSGKVIWIKAGASAESVLLGAEVTRSIREKRLDVRLAFTFEQERPELIAPRLRGLEKVGYGYGPADRPSAWRRVLDAFAPIGVVYAGIAPPPYLNAELAERRVRQVVVAAAPARGQFDAVYPVGHAQVAAWRGAGGAAYLAPPADFLSLLVEPQVDPNFKTVVSGGRDARLWWLDGVDAVQAKAFVDQWTRSPLRDSGILFIGPRPGAHDAVRRGIDSSALHISAWKRNPIAPGSLVLLDDARWLPAIAASVMATHLVQAKRLHLWQALAGGCPVTLGESDVTGYLGEEADLEVKTDISDVLTAWGHYAQDPMIARRLGDALRRAFWKERRDAGTVADEFLQRVYDW
jgi:hypothetical protein